MKITPGTPDEPLESSFEELFNNTAGRLRLVLFGAEFPSLLGTSAIERLLIMEKNITPLQSHDFQDGIFYGAAQGKNRLTAEWSE